MARVDGERLSVDKWMPGAPRASTSAHWSVAYASPSSDSSA